MNKKILMYLFLCAFMLVMFPSCEKYYATDPSDNEQTDDSSGIEDPSDYIWDNSKIIHITLNGNTITVDSTGATVDGSIVTITSSGTYSIIGSLANGQIIVNTEDNEIVRLILNGVNITCSSSAPIYVKSAVKAMIVLADNTENYVTDGVSYVLDADNEPNAAIFSKFYLSFYGSGSLTVHANYNDGISSKDGLLIKSGTINVSSKDDGIRGKDYLIIKDGNIVVNSNGDGLKSDNDKSTTYGYIIIETGILNITAGDDGIQSQTSLVINGGTFNINNSGDVTLETSGSGYDPTYSTGIKCNGNITIGEANITIKSTGKAGKGISTDGDINITSGTIKITTSGVGATYKNSNGTTDSYSATCITADGNISILGGSVITSSSGAGGKGISADGTITLGETNNSPTINITTTGAKFVVSGTDYCHPKAIKSTGAITINNGIITIASSDDGIHSEASITINNGTVSITNSYEAIESLYITINGGNVRAIATNDAINATAGKVSGGSESNDGSCFYMNGGTLYASCSNGDAIDSNGNIVITGGTVIANAPAAGVEEASDFNGTFNMKGGFFIGVGANSNMNKTMSSISTQRNIYVLSRSQISAGFLFHIQNASGIDIVTFKPERAYYSILFSSSSLTTDGIYTLYTGGACTGTVSNGLYSGGIYSGGTLRKSFTLSTTGTVTSVSF